MNGGAEPGGSLDAENVCGLTGKFGGGASDLNVPADAARRQESRR